MPSNKQKLYDVVSGHLSSGVFSCGDVFNVIDQLFPGTPHDSIIPSDYLVHDAVKTDPSNEGNRGQDITYPRFLERIGRNKYRFVAWDGVPQGAIDAPVLRAAA